MAVHLSIGRIRFVPLAVPLAVSLAALVGLAVVAGAVYLPIHPGPEVEPASAVAESVSGTRQAPAEIKTETALIHEVAVSVRPEKAPETARIATAGAVDAGPAAGAGEKRVGTTGPKAAASQPLAPREQVAVARRVVEPRDLVAPRNLAEPDSRPENTARPENMAPIPARAPRRADTGTTARSDRTLFERGAKIELKAKKDANVYITSRNIPDSDRLLEAYSADQAAKGSSAPGLLDIASQAYRTQASAGSANKAYSLADAMRDAVWRKKTAAKLKTLMTARNTCPEVEADSGASKPSIGFGNIC